MPDVGNPWVSRPQTPSPVVVIPHNPLSPPTGPTSPQRGIPAPDRVDQLPTLDQSAPAQLWWLGTHGGAGETSLAALMPDWASAGHGWPRVRGQQEPSRVVLTARSNVRGLRAAQAAATQWAAGMVPFVDLIGLVIVADAPGRMPRPLRDLALVVSGGAPRTWNVPWVEPWRLGEQPALDDAPREVRRLVDELRVILRPGADGTTH